MVEKGATGCGVSMNALGTRVASDFSANTFLSDAAEDAVLQQPPKLSRSRSERTERTTPQTPKPQPKTPVRHSDSALFSLLGAILHDDRVEPRAKPWFPLKGFRGQRFA